MSPLEPSVLPPPSHPPGSATPVTGQAPAAAEAPCWSSSQLLGGQREAHISHEGTTYRLRLTSLGKLILTK